MKTTVTLLVLVFWAFWPETECNRSSGAQDKRQAPSITNNVSYNDPAVCQQSKLGSRRCDDYHMTHCAPIVKYYNTSIISINCTYKQEKAEQILNVIARTLVSYYGASDECLKGSQWSLCLMLMPPGCNDTSILQGVLCREACLLVKDHLCYNEWRRIASLQQSGILSKDIVIPDCNDFPTMEQKNEDYPCLYPDLFKVLEKLHKSKQNKRNKGNNLVLIMSACGGVLFLVIFASAVVLLRRSRRKRNQQQQETVSFDNLPNPMAGLASGYSSNIAYAGDNPLYSKDIGLENLNVQVIQREHLRYIEPLAEGAFGKVIKCELIQTKIDSKEKSKLAAVKYLKDNALDKFRESFIKEVQTLASFNHPNIVSLFGICTDNKGPLCMVLEFMKMGDLTRYIRERSGSYHASFGRHGVLPNEVTFVPPGINFRKLCGMAKQIASGMAYLAERRFVHRDLATRNCLLDNGDSVKIGDFGLAHDISSSESDYYRIDGQRLLPIRWLPPEAITVGKFTVHSDIWAFGVLLWELFTYGLQPYLGQSNDEVCDRIRCLKLLNRPDGCPQRVYQLMKNCWKYDPTKRTPFSKLDEILTGWAGTVKGQFLDDAWQLMLKPSPVELAPTLPVKRRIQK